MTNGIGKIVDFRGLKIIKEEPQQNKRTPQDSSEGLAAKILEAFGGKDNLIEIEACITRLRVTVKVPSQVDKAVLKQLGAADVVEMGNNIHAIFGTQSYSLMGQIKNITS